MGLIDGVTAADPPISWRMLSGAANSPEAVAFLPPELFKCAVDAPPPLLLLPPAVPAAGVSGSIPDSLRPETPRLNPEFSSAGGA